MKEIEEKFLKGEAENVFEEYKKQVITRILANEEVVKEQIFKVLQSIAEQSTEKDYEVSLIDFSLLQIGILKETYEISVSAYGKDLYADEGLSETFKIDYIFKDLKNIKENLYQSIKKYVGKIKHCAIDYYILQQFRKYNEYFIYFLVKIFKKWDEDESFVEMKKAETLRVIYGEYKDYSQTVYYYDSFEKTQKLFKEKIKNNISTEFIFSYCKGLKASDFRLENRDISCMNLKESNLKNCEFKLCKGIGLNFENSHIKKCRFESCDLSACDFSNASLENIVFEKCILRDVSFKGTRFEKVYLIDSNNKVSRILNK